MGEYERWLHEYRRRAQIKKLAGFLVTMAFYALFLVGLWVVIGLILATQ